MRVLRWAGSSALLISVVLLAGCSAFPRLVKRAEYDRLKSYEKLSKDLNARLLELANEKDALNQEAKRLQSLLDAIRDQGTDKDKLLALQNTTIQEQERRIKELEEMLKAQPAKPSVTLPTSLEEGVTLLETPFGPGVRVEGDLLFDPGKAQFKPGGEEIIRKIAQLEMVRDPTKHIRVCGYTDSDPIRVSGWTDNFQLSGERALTVLRALAKEGIDPSRMHFVGFGEHMLIRDKDGKEDKARSRRVEIYVIEPVQTATEKPVPSEKPSGKPVVPK